MEADISHMSHDGVSCLVARCQNFVGEENQAQPRKDANHAQHRKQIICVVVGRYCDVRGSSTGWGALGYDMVKWFSVVMVLAISCIRSDI